MMKSYLQPVDEVLRAHATSSDAGLTSAQVEQLAAAHGPNRLAKAKRESLVLRFFKQMADPMVILLIVAAFISAFISVYEGTGEFADVIIILFVVLLNSILGVVQESKAEEALEALQEMSATQTTVIRDGRVTMIPSADLVPGDVVILEAGNAVPADCRIIESATCKIEESALTGESSPVRKTAAALSPADPDGDIPLGDRVNMCYMGSTVVYGRARAVVVATGMSTEMGKIAGAISSASEERTPLQLKLAQLSKMLTVLVIAISAVIFALGLFQHRAQVLEQPSLLVDTFMIAVSLAVAAIPEGLVAVVTITLSIGVTKMSKRNAIIRKLTAVETLGCAQVICSDKTGTLTQNRMTVVRRYTSDEQALLTTMALCNDAVWDTDGGFATGEPTETALVADAEQEGISTRELSSRMPRRGEVPFDSERKMMSVVVGQPDGSLVQHTKGAPDEILKRCTSILMENGLEELTEDRRAQILAANKAMSDDALRVLAAARREWSELPDELSSEMLEQSMTFIGLSGIIDPVRPEVKDAIDEARGAGVRTVMITGDHIDTAVAIARELKIIADRSEAITGAELEKMTDDEFEQRITQINVYARVQPEHKVRIVETWKRLGKVVAMTGDGVNDAPALKRADIGVGMGITGTDVTKNVADMVLADDNFATIVSAVEEGRRIYDNICKTTQFLLSSNLAEVLSVLIATMMGFTILQPTHLLFINLITDSFPALAMGMEGFEPGVMKRKPRPPKASIFSDGLGVDTFVQGVMISALTFASYFIGHYLEYGTTDISNVIAQPGLGAEGITMAFLTLSMVQVFHSFNLRSRRRPVFKMRKQNLWLWGSFAVGIVLTFVVIEVPFFANAFGFAQLDPVAYAIAFGFAIVIVPIIELYKVIANVIDRAIARRKGVDAG